MTFLSFLVGMGMLCWSGWALARQVVPGGERLLRGLVALPLGALAHALLLAKLTLLGVPLQWWSLLLPHAVFGAVFLFLPTPFHPSALPQIVLTHWRFDGPVRALLILLLVVQAVFAVAHAAILPTYHIDSLTNWTMRAKVSWEDRALAFDQTEARGVAKPQYPFLVHGVQMAAVIVAPAWSDRSANTSTLLLTLSSLGALFVLLKKLRGTTVALLGLTAIAHIPLLSFHLAQGYGDIHLVTALLLALAFVLAARITDDARWYIGSALFIAAASWTKTEGIVVGLLPWLLLLAIDLPWPAQRKYRIAGMSLGLVLSVLFPLFLLLKGLPFTPHESDAAFGLHPEAIGPALAGFVSPSMGLTWPALFIALLSIVFLWRRNDPRIDCRPLITLGWGLLALVIVLATYTLTPNVRFLLNGESYFRQLMVPAALLWLAVAGSLRPLRDTQPDRG